jgi:hypothetical protein
MRNLVVVEVINIGDKCVECGEDTAFGTGKFINRIPAEVQESADHDRIDGYMCGDCVSEAEEEWAQFSESTPPVREMKIKMAQKLVRQAVETYAEEARGNGMSVSDYFDLKQALESIDELILRYTEGDDE